MTKIIITGATAAVLGFALLASAPARAATPTDAGYVPLSFAPLVPFMLFLSTKENKKFKAVNPYGNKPSKKK